VQEVYNDKEGQAHTKIDITTDMNWLITLQLPPRR
jgi:hypothetical protein